MDINKFLLVDIVDICIFRLRLNSKLSETRESLTKAEIEFRSCLSAGSEFERIAQEYARLKKDIEARSWALNELKSAKQHKPL